MAAKTTDLGQEWRDVEREVLGSDDAVNLYLAAIEAAHLFARATKCPAGHNVAAWVNERGDAVLDAWRKHLAAEA